MEGGGFPHSDIRGSKPADGSPRLFAVCRVLHRLTVPRHPSCARIRLARYNLASRYVAILFKSSTSVFKEQEITALKAPRWWRQPDSDRRHPACKADTLPTELCPLGGMVGLTRVELVTSSLSGTRSNQLSYKPGGFFSEGRRNTRGDSCGFQLGLSRRPDSPGRLFGLLLRKEVIQPLVPQRLPCYDFIPITTHTLGRRMPDFGCRRLS